MHTVYQGTHYRLEFQRPPSSKKRRITRAILLTRDTPDEKWIEIASGQTRCSRKDTFSKETGRQLALERLLLTYPEQINRPFRRMIWTMYNDRLPKGSATQRTLLTLAMTLEVTLVLPDNAVRPAVNDVAVALRQAAKRC